MSVVTATVIGESGVIGHDICNLMSLDIRREVNRIPRATLTLLDGDSAESEFVASNSGHFDPGKEIQVKLRYEDKPQEEAIVFKGLVVRHNLEANNHLSQLTVELKDAAVKLTKARKSAIFVDQTDKQVIEKLVSEAKLKSGVVDATDTKHAHLVQYDCTDWDFIVSRAESQGLLVIAEDGELSVRAVDLAKLLAAQAPKSHQLKYGDNIYELELSLDAEEQYEAVDSRAWDVTQNKMTDPKNLPEFSFVFSC